MRGVSVRANVGVVARDGTRLSTDLYLPASGTRAPAVLIRTPYDNTLPFLVEKGRRLADHGYVVAIQDCRGRFDSDGTYEPFRTEGPDGFDTIEWLAAQPWCDGRVGMAGRSYAGWTQWTAALERAPHLRAIVPRAMAPDLHRGLVWRGGAFNLGVLMLWGLTTSGRSMQEIDRLDWIEAFRTLPLTEAAATASQDVEHWRWWLDHPLRDDAWADGQLVPMSGLDVPALVMGGWYDLYADDMLTAWAELRASDSAAAAGSRLVVGPWPHALSESTVTGELDFGARSQLDLEGLELPLVRSLAPRRAERRGARGAGAVVRHGLERVAGRARVAPGPDGLADVAPPLGRRRARHCWATARCRGRRPHPTSRPTRSAITLTTPCPRRVARTAAGRRSCPGDRTTSGTWRCAPTSCATPATP